jgi:hypothetical protein
VWGEPRWSELSGSQLRRVTVHHPPSPRVWLAEGSFWCPRWSSDCDLGRRGTDQTVIKVDGRIHPRGPYRSFAVLAHDTPVSCASSSRVEPRSTAPVLCRSSFHITLMLSTLPRCCTFKADFPVRIKVLQPSLYPKHPPRSPPGRQNEARFPTATPAQLYSKCFSQRRIHANASVVDKTSKSYHRAQAECHRPKSFPEPPTHRFPCRRNQATIPYTMVT